MPDKAENVLPFIKTSASFNEPLMILTEHMEVPYVNKPAEKLFDIKRDPKKNIPLGKLLDLKKGDKEKILHEARKTRGKRRNLRFNAFGKNDALIPVEIQATKIKDIGKIFYILKTIDLTEKVATIDKLRNEKKNIELLKSIAVAANEASSFEVAIRFSLNKICQNTGWHIGHAYRVFYTDRTVLESMDIWTHAGKIPIESLKKKTAVLLNSSYKELPVKALKKLKTEWVSDITEDDTFLRAKEASEAGIKSAIAFPILVEDKGMAVIEFFSKESIDAPDKKFLELLENIGIILGRVIEREEGTKKLEDAYNELQNAQKLVIHNEKLAAIGRFSSGLAHEIRNPLANINAAVQYLSGKYTQDERLSDSLKIIERNGKSATNIITEMLKYASPTDFKLTKGSINDVIEDIHHMIKARCNKNGIKCIKTMGNGIPDIKMNSDKIGEALMNFLSNAIDSMEDGGTLTISVDTIEDQVEIKIKDTGIGIRKEDLDRIFDPFFTKKKHGTGLGMSLAGNIIKAHKGDIRVLSKVGKGTEVIITLPI